MLPLTTGPGETGRMPSTFGAGEGEGAGAGRVTTIVGAGEGVDRERLAAGVA